MSFGSREPWDPSHTRTPPPKKYFILWFYDLVWLALVSINWYWLVCLTWLHPAWLAAGPRACRRIKDDLAQLLMQEAPLQHVFGLDDHVWRPWERWSQMIFKWSRFFDMMLEYFRSMRPWNDSLLGMQAQRLLNTTFPPRGSRWQGHKNLESVVGAAVHRQTGRIKPKKKRPDKRCVLVEGIRLLFGDVKTFFQRNSIFNPI